MIPTAYCQIGPGISSVPLIVPSRLQTKIWLVMKMTAFLLLVTCLHVSASGYSQKISLSVREVPLEKVFKEIQRQSGYTFFYKTRQVDKTVKITLDLRNATLDEALNKCFENQPYEYTIVEQTVVVKRREVITPAPPPMVVRGKVTTAAGKPLSGVSVTIRATKKGTTTDENGEFTVSVRKEDILIFSYVGYDTREVKVGEQTTIDITLIEATASLNEIAVIGYGRANRKSLSTAISTPRLSGRPQSSTTPRRISCLPGTCSSGPLIGPEPAPPTALISTSQTSPARSSPITPCHSSANG